MNGSALMSPDETAPKIAGMFADGAPCRIDTREDRAFKGEEWFDPGEVSLQFGGSSEGSETPVENGAFEWRLPDVEGAGNTLSELLDMSGLLDMRKSGNQRWYRLFSLRR